MRKYDLLGPCCPSMFHLYEVAEVSMIGHMGSMWIISHQSAMAENCQNASSRLEPGFFRLTTPSCRLLDHLLAERHMTVAFSLTKNPPFLS